MNKIELASKYSAIESALGFKPAAIRDVILKNNSIDGAFNFLYSNSSHSQKLSEDYEQAFKILSGLGSVGILVRSLKEYPTQLSSWTGHTEVLYVKGNHNLLSLNSVAVVGSRAASDEGRLRASKIAKILSENNYSVTSGLALGIDTAAHIGALRCGGKTIAVIGTPINQYYPKENKELQDLISMHGTVVSQFSVIRRTQPLNFPLRNELMSALSLATVIVEASETSGALTQAKFCLKQGKKLFIMQNQIDRTDLSWPREFLKRGAIALKSVDDLLTNLAKPTSTDGNEKTQLKFL